MSTLLENINAIIDLFHEYSTTDKETDTLSREELKELLEREFRPVLKVRDISQDPRVYHVCFAAAWWQYLWSLCKLLLLEKKRDFILIQNKYYFPLFTHLIYYVHTKMCTTQTHIHLLWKKYKYLMTKTEHQKLLLHIMFPNLKNANKLH